MKKQVQIKAKDGGTFSAFVSYPDTDLSAPGVIVIQEIFGVNENMRNICLNLSQAGYIALCPDLFWRLEPGVELTDKTEKDWQKGFELYQRFDSDQGVEDLKDALGYLRQQKDCTGKVGTIGYCLGGRLAFLMAERSDADCNVSYYGVGIESHLNDSAKIKKPLLMHMAGKDKFVPFAAQQKIRTALNSHSNVELHVYQDMDHAFARVGGQHYDSAAAHQADSRTADFLATVLGRENRQKAAK